MSQIPDIRLAKEPGLGRAGALLDAISALVMVIPNEPGSPGLEFGDIVSIKSLIEAEQVYLIDEDFDTNNNVLLHHHIKRFFERQPAGKLWVMILEDAALGIAEATIMTDEIPKLLMQANGEIRQLGYISGTLNTPLSFNDRLTALQLIVEDAFDGHMPLHVVTNFVFSGTAAAAADLRAQDRPGVSVCIAQDADVADIDPAYQDYAAIGDCLGHIAFARVNESIGWVGKFPLTDTSIRSPKFLRCNLTSNLPIESYTIADLQLLHEKGYLFARPHAGRPGYFWQSSPTVADAASDEAYIENARTLNKAARVIRQSLLDRLNSPVLLNTDGTIESSELSELEAIAGSGLNQMVKDSEASAVGVTIDNTANFIANNETIDIEFEVVPVGVARNIKGTLRLTAQLQ